MSIYASVLRPLLFRLDPERAHALAIGACEVAGRTPLVPAFARRALSYSSPKLACEVAGLRFGHPVGLAAGFDKSGRALRMLDALGFGFAEIGSVSADPSQGNPKPRLFRLPADRAIVVNYGLPNDGADAVSWRVAGYRCRVPLGINVVKTNRGLGPSAESDDLILDDYRRSVATLHPHADYLMLNLSCPNAERGRDFFDRPGAIRDLLAILAPLEVACPVFLKLAPVSDDATLDRILEEVELFPFVRGFSFNLPPGKPDDLALKTPSSVWRGWPGAVSGPPVSARIDDCVRRLYRRMPRERYAIIASGGVSTAEDAYRKIRLGASLVQIYTALVYEGPGVPKKIAAGLAELLRRDGFANVSEAVGVDAARSNTVNDSVLVRSGT